MHKYCSLGEDAVCILATSLPHMITLCKKNEHRFKLWLTGELPLNIRSTCKTTVIKTVQLHSYMIFSATSAVAWHSLPARTASPINEGRNLDDDEINAQAVVIFGLWNIRQYFSTL